MVTDDHEAAGAASFVVPHTARFGAVALPQHQLVAVAGVQAIAEAPPVAALPPVALGPFPPVAEVPPVVIDWLDPPVESGGGCEVLSKAG